MVTGGSPPVRLGLMPPIGVGALGEGRPVPWRVLREMARVAAADGFHELMLATMTLHTL